LYSTGLGRRRWGWREERRGRRGKEGARKDRGREKIGEEIRERRRGEERRGEERRGEERRGEERRGDPCRGEATRGEPERRGRGEGEEKELVPTEFRIFPVRKIAPASVVP
jgi:hypothetical protein